MNSTQLLNQVGDLSATLGELDSDVAELKHQLRSFAGDLADEETPTALPVEFDPSSARQQLDAKLAERHKASAQLQEAEAKYKTARQTELDKALADIERRYKQTVVTMLKAAVTLARCAQDCESLREEGRRITGGQIGQLPHVGAGASHFDLNDRSSFVAHWIGEAKRAGYIDGSESWLAGIKF